MGRPVLLLVCPFALTPGGCSGYVSASLVLGALFNQ